MCHFVKGLFLTSSAYARQTQCFQVVICILTVSRKISFSIIINKSDAYHDSSSMSFIHTTRAFKKMNWSPIFKLNTRWSPLPKTEKWMLSLQQILTSLLQYLVMHKHDRTQTAAVTVITAKTYTGQQLHLCIKKTGFNPGQLQKTLYSSTDTLAWFKIRKMLG